VKNQRIESAISPKDFRHYFPLLYMPADRPGAVKLLENPNSLMEKFNVVICLEDAVRVADRKEAARRVIRWLPSLPPSARRGLFIRPAGDEMFHRLAESHGADGVAGFVLPKATVVSIAAWCAVLKGRSLLMPVIETGEALNSQGRKDLADVCAAHRTVIPRARIGANDLYSLLGGLRRPRGCTVYETPLAHIIDSLLEYFSRFDMPLSGCVFDRLDDSATLLRECVADVARGLFAKTAVNPKQAEMIRESYRPDALEVAEAKAILCPSSPAVFTLNGSMLEPTCHSRWASRLLERAASF
jgi:citrate lyase beta subunit